MFTGIIQTIGQLTQTVKKEGDLQITITADLSKLEPVSHGVSIAVNGVCLTVVEFTESFFIADVSCETLRKTSFQDLMAGAYVNLEPSLTLATLISGHLVMGHVDGIGIIKSINNEARSTRLEITVPEQLTKYIVQKGSICIDGISLTVNEINNNVASINIVPHTLSETIIQYYRVGVKVNIEVDVVARYLESLIRNDVTLSEKNRNLKDLLQQQGFIQ